MKIIPYSRQTILAQDIRAVSQTLRAGWITQGPKISEFESAIALYCGAKYAVAVANGTAALHLACLAVGLGKGDEAVTTPISFLATSNAVIYAGATPVFADIDYDTINIDPEKIRTQITARTKVILPVDFAGLPAPMKEIKKLASRHGLAVIEDASHALGARYDRTAKVGSCRYSDMTTFSFHPVKHITTGEGGCITTNSRVLYEKLKALRSHGVYRNSGVQKKLGPWYYEMKELGMNYRLTDFQAALGMSQLRRLEQFIERRDLICKRYDEAFRDLKKVLKIPTQKILQGSHVRHLYLLRLAAERPAPLRRRLFDYLRANRIQPQVHYIPIYRQPYYRRFFQNKKVRCPQADRYYDEVLSLPLYPDMKEHEIRHTINTVKRFFGSFL